MKRVLLPVKISRALSQSNISFTTHHQHPDYATQRTTIDQANRQAAQGGRISETTRVSVFASAPPRHAASTLGTMSHYQRQMSSYRAVERVFFRHAFLLTGPGGPKRFCGLIEPLRMRPVSETPAQYYERPLRSGAARTSLRGHWPSLKYRSELGLRRPPRR